MREMLERLLRSADVPNPERAEQLWVEYRAGGPGAGNAFAVLLAWYGNAIYRRIWGFVRSDAAEDVFQDVLARLHKTRKNLATFDHALRWLRTVAVAASLNAHRSKRRRRARDERAARPEAEPAAKPTAELQEAIRVGLAELPDELRQVVALHFFEGLTKRDAAAVLGIDRDTVAKRLQEALKQLRKLVPVPAVAAGGVAVLEAKLAAGPPLTPTRLAALIAVAGPAAVGGWLWSVKAKVVAVALVVGLAAVASGYYLTRSPDMPAQSSQPRFRPAVTPLEPRTVPAGLVSALSVGDAGGSTLARDMVTDAAGNSYITGHFLGTTDFDPAHTHPGDADILIPRGSGDMYVAKYAPDNTLIWVRRMGGDAVNNTPGTPEAPTDIGQAIHVDAGGNVYVTGQFMGEGDFGPVTLTSAGDADGFVAKLDPSGSVLWANRWGVAIRDHAYGIGVDSAGNAYVLGGKWDRTETIASQSGYDVQKYSPTGAAVWAKSFATKNLSLDAGLAVDAAGNVFVAGQFRYTVDFDPGTGKKDVKLVSSGPTRSGFVLKLTSNGTFNWVSPFVGQGSGATAGASAAASIALDGTGNVVVGGYYDNLVDFNPGTGTTTLPAGGGGYIVKLNSTGSLVWTRAIEKTDGTTLVYGLDTDAGGNIYATGTFSGTTDFDPGSGTHTRTTAGGSDIYVLKLTAAGNFAWAETFGASANDVGYGIDVNAAGTVHLTGRYRGSIDFDPGAGTHELTAPGDKSSFYLVKLSQN